MTSARTIGYNRSTSLDLAMRLREFLEREWFGNPLHRLSVHSHIAGTIVHQPVDPRPVSIDRGQAMLSGQFELASVQLRFHHDHSLFDSPLPTKRSAEVLHRFDWLGDLVACGEAGEILALECLEDWIQVFGTWNSFSWGADLLEGRVRAWAYYLKPLLERVDPQRAELIIASFIAQARHLIKIRARPSRFVERALTAALAGCALSGMDGHRLLGVSIKRLCDFLPMLVLPDGGHASRAPSAGYNLFLDLSSLNEALVATGRAVPDTLRRARERLEPAVGFFTRADGRLGAFHGGESLEVKTAGEVEQMKFPDRAPHSGYLRLQTRSLSVLVDAGAPPNGIFAETACLQPQAMEIASASGPLIINSGWTLNGGGPDALREPSAASMATLSKQMFGVRLRRGRDLIHVGARRQDSQGSAWVELEHDGWLKAHGLVQHRRLFANMEADEIRGEESFLPSRQKRGRKAHYAPFSTHFHLAPNVKADLGADRRTVLIQNPADERWVLRHDALEVSLERSVCLRDGALVQICQIVLQGQSTPVDGGQIRWKLNRAQ